MNRCRCHKPPPKVASVDAQLDINANAAVYSANAKLPEVQAAILSSSPGHAVNGNK